MFNFTMKSKIKENYPLGACGTDTNTTKTFRVYLRSTVVYETDMDIPAKSAEKAKNLAERLARHTMHKQWKMVGHDLIAFDAKQLKEGGWNV